MSRDPLKSWVRVFPELARFDTVEDRIRAWKYAARSLRRSTRFWVAALTVGLVGTPVAVMLASRLQHLAANWLPFPPAVVRVALGTCIGGLFGLTLVRLFQRSIRRSLRTQLNDAGIPICMGCGYDVRCQTERRCSECGRPFDRSAGAS